MDEAFETTLETLLTRDGVGAALVSDATGRVVAAKADSVFDAAAIAEMGRTVRSVVGSIQSVHSDWQVVSAQFSGANLLVANLASEAGAPVTMMLSLIADKRYPEAEVRAALEAAATKLRTRVKEAVSKGESLRGSAPEIVAKDVTPALAAEIEEYLGDLSQAAGSKNGIPRF